MGTITYNYTITNNKWFDATPVMSNYLKLKSEINGELDQNNVDDTTNLTVNNIVVSEKMNTEDLIPSGSLTIKLASNFNFDIKTSDSTTVFELEENGDISADGKFNTFPIGSIVPFAVVAWTNNSTISGWYKCDGNNGTINLVDKFIRGSTTSGSTGGSNDSVIVSHTHTASTGNASATHTHLIDTNVDASGMPHTHSLRVYNIWSGFIRHYINTNFSSYYLTSTAAADAHTHDISQTTSGNNSVDHQHTVTIDNTGVSATGANMPAYYKTIFIQRVS